MSPFALARPADRHYDCPRGKESLWPLSLFAAQIFCISYHVSQPIELYSGSRFTWRPPLLLSMADVQVFRLESVQSQFAPLFVLWFVGPPPTNFARLPESVLFSYRVTPAKLRASELRTPGGAADFPSLVFPPPFFFLVAFLGTFAKAPLLLPSSPIDLLRIGLEAPTHFLFVSKHLELSRK